MTSKDTIAVLGAGGTMGQGISRNLIKAGFAVRAWNRTRDRAEPLAKDGASVCDTPSQAAENADVVLTMLADTDAVLETMAGDDDAALHSPSFDGLWLQMSTIGEGGTDSCIELAQERGIVFVDAPVLGTKQPAQEGKLVVLASGPNEAKDRTEPIFDAIGQKTLWVGEAGAGTKLKLVTNSWIVAVVEGAAETVALAEGLGVDPELFFEAIDGGPLDLPYLRMKGKAMTERNFDPSFSLKLAAKDARLVEEAAESRGLDLPVVSAIRERLEEGVPEHGDEDLSATFLTSART